MPECPASPSASSAGEGLARRQRLTRNGSFQETFAQGRKQVGRCMVLWVRRGEGASLRLGVVSSRKVGGAVQRNRARRRLREVFRRDRAQLTGAADVVLVARRAAVDAPFPALRDEFLKLAGRSGILAPDRSRDTEAGE